MNPHLRCSSGVFSSPLVHVKISFVIRINDPFHEFVMAVERVEQRLLRVVSALDAENIPYTVVGGNAVAAWVASKNPGAVRVTQDVDILIRREQLDRVTAALEKLGFIREDLRSIVLFLDPAERNRKTGVHLVWANEKTRPSYAHAAPDVSESTRLPGGRFPVPDLPALIRMKLTSFRDKDRTHIADMLDVGLIDDRVRNSLPPDLLERLKQIEATHEAELAE